MKTLLFFAALISASLASQAQVNLDSFWTIWNDETQADTIRLEAVYFFIHGGLNNEFGLNPLYGQNSDSLSAIIERVHEMTEASESKKYQILEVRLRGISHQIIKNHPDAVKLYAQALEMAKTLKDRRLILLTMVTLANSVMSWGFANGDTARIAEAEEHFLEALNLFEQDSVNSNMVGSKIDPQVSHYGFTTLYRLGHLNLLLNKASKGIQYLEEAAALAEQSGNNSDESYALSLLGIAQARQYDSSNALQNLEKAVLLAAESGDEGALEFSMGQLGNFLKAQENYPAAIQYYTKCLTLAEQKGDNHWIAHNLQSLGGLYNQAKEFAKAEDYLTRALASMQAAPGHEAEQKEIYIGLHDCYIALKRFSSALTNDSLFLIFAAEYDASSVPTGLTCLAEAYYELGDYSKALEYGFQGLKANDELAVNNDPYLRNYLFLIIGNTYRKQNLFAKAIIECEKANIDVAVWVQKSACECLYKAHKALKHSHEALAYHEKFLVLTDSLNNNELGKDLQQMEFSKQMLADSLAQEEEKLQVAMAHQSTVNQKDKTRNILLGSGFLVLLMAGGLWNRLDFTRKSKATLQVEKDRSENLLLNILPAEVAEELKVNGVALAKDFDLVSIIFTDFKGFTATSAKLTAGELVSELNYCFKGFDMIMEKYGIEKIKTIGDAYMAAGGLALNSDDAAKNTVLAALEMQELIIKRKEEQNARGLMAFEMRTGIHTGPVVAGIVGVKKFQYDLWGDTVNTASRMESEGKVGQVNISEDTYEQIKDDPTFSFKKLGKIQVKGKGEMGMYSVSS